MITTIVLRSHAEQAPGADVARELKAGLSRFIPHFLAELFLLNSQLPGQDQEQFVLRVVH